MAHKSKTQRAKATQAKANRRDRQERDEIAAQNATAVEESADEKKKGGLLKSNKTEKTETKPVVKEEKKPKKTRFKFLKDVRAEMKRVTWPTRQDVIRWSGVVVGALLFFGIYVAILDNLIITPGLVALTGLGA